MATRIQQQEALLKALTSVVAQLERLGYDDEIPAADALLLRIARRAHAERQRNRDVVPFERPPRGSRPKKR